MAGTRKATAGRARASSSRTVGGTLNQITLTPPKKVGAGDLAGFGAGLLAYVLVLNYLRNGKAGVTGWLDAKFLNNPHPELARAGSSSGTPTLPAIPPGAIVRPITGDLESTRPTVVNV
ncbi:hypothetical protein [Nocardioides sp.]|uniref:hypothetical protein n=1 Tax=Nocardioides sp. TaxID=35761 RepID=UPI002CE99681|nr:hypothetical protein [Nocardioides sp.]HSX68124.1 hypothetical protein [Nocardioides sp.]